MTPMISLTVPTAIDVDGVLPYLDTEPAPVVTSPPPVPKKRKKKRGGKHI